jgi:hypothetical protein
MASGNLDLLRSIFADWDRGDFSSAAWADPETEFVVADGLEPGSWKGVAAMARRFRDVLNAWEDVRVKAPQYRELDAERVLVFYEYSGHGRHSGISMGPLAGVRESGASVFSIRDDRVRKLVLHYDVDRALADLGLAPESDTAA